MTRGLFVINGCMTADGPDEVGPGPGPCWPPWLETEPNGVEGVLGVAIYRPPHLGHLPGSPPSPVPEVGLEAGPPLPPRRG